MTVWDEDPRLNIQHGHRSAWSEYGAETDAGARRARIRKRRGSADLQIPKRHGPTECFCWPLKRGYGAMDVVLASGSGERERWRAAAIQGEHSRPSSKASGQPPKLPIMAAENYFPKTQPHYHPRQLNRSP